MTRINELRMQIEQLQNELNFLLTNSKEHADINKVLSLLKYFGWELDSEIVYDRVSLSCLNTAGFLKAIGEDYSTFEDIISDNVTITLPSDTIRIEPVVDETATVIDDALTVKRFVAEHGITINSKYARSALRDLIKEQEEYLENAKKLDQIFFDIS